jgi:hypothetical protein
MLMLAAAVLVLALFASTWATGGTPSVAALASAGQMTFVVPGTSDPLDGAGGNALFGLRFPGGTGACPGDSASGGYRIQSYIVPDGVDPSTLTYDATGPVPGDFGANLRQPLYKPDGSGYVAQLTGPASTAGGPGDIPTLPGFTFSVFAPDALTYIPAGRYNVGIACSLTGATAKFWTAQLDVVADPDDPTGLAWEPVGASQATTTTTSTTTTTTTTTIATGGTSSTTSSTSTSTTVAGGSTTSSTTTSTTVAGGSTTSTTRPSTTLVASGAGSGSGGSGSSSQPHQLASTGSSSWPTVVWALLLVVIGRMIYLVSRPARVIPGGH